MDRKRFTERLTGLFATHPVVALLGPRQCGKTTLAREYAGATAHFFDLENPRDERRLEEPLLALENLSGLVVIDEIQRAPNLFKILRVLADRPKSKTRFLILGSASRDLLQQSAETLAGRIAHLELTPFNAREIGLSKTRRHWLRGGFPRSYLARTDSESGAWRESYVSTFLERDIPSLGFRIPPRTLRRFWMMLAFYHGQIFNGSEMGRSLGVAHTTVRHYLDILEGTFMVRVLTPWVENVGKRLVKSPKIFFRDSGLFHALSNIPDERTLLTHPKLGASWEGYALEETIRFHEARDEEVFFWGTHGDAEVDLLVFRNGQRLGYEFKYGDAPRRTRSMLLALEDLRLDSLTVLHPGKSTYPLGKNITAQGLSEFLEQGSKN